MLDPSVAACVDAFEASEDHKIMKSAAPVRSATEVKSVLGDLWEKLLALGSQVNWPLVYQKIMPIISMLFAGKSVQEVLAVILSWFTPAPVVMP